VIIDYCNFCNKENIKFSSSLSDEEESEKETKEKSEKENEKYFSKSAFILITSFQLTDNQKFIWFCTQLNLHPYQGKRLQPPKAV
jgi:uncharacterized protein YqhQ